MNPFLIIGRKIKNNAMNKPNSWSKTKSSRLKNIFIHQYHYIINGINW
jgi:hypothetical protein